MNETIIVCCPGNCVTGGPELLHQLVHELRAQGKQAFICYYPFAERFSTPAAYVHYATPQKGIIDSCDTLVIFPETATHLIPRLSHSRIGIWWLSVNSYLGKIHKSSWKNVLEDIYWKIKGKKNTFQMLNYLHYSQSYYASAFLESKGIHAEILTDYLGKSHMQSNSKPSMHLNQIAYNPKKGFEKTQELIRRNHDLSFVPIEGMSADQVNELLKHSKIYIDFGIHPGKDRFPREAVMAGCCIITGRQGSAANPVDIPIAEKYKLNDNLNNYLDDFRPLVDNIFSNFDCHSMEFENYRAVIRAEPGLFREQVKQLFIDRSTNKE